MIRIMIESKQDQENFKKWIATSGIPEAAVEAVANKYEEMRKNLSAPENGYQYWMNEKGDALEFARWVRAYSTGGDKRKFVKLFGEAAYNTLTNPMNIAKCVGNRCSIQGWLRAYDREITPVPGKREGRDPKVVQGELSDAIARVIKENQLYSPEDVAKIEEGTEIAYKGQGWTVVRVYNYPASKYWGSGSGWCTSGAFGDTDTHFNNYIRDGKVKWKHNGKPYYLIYRSDKGDLYNALNPDIIYIGTSHRDITVPKLPDNAPISLEDATQGDFDWDEYHRRTGR